jgi:hypothetical protein
VCVLSARESVETYHFTRHGGVVDFRRQTSRVPFDQPAPSKFGLHLHVAWVVVVQVHMQYENYGNV